MKDSNKLSEARPRDPRTPFQKCGKWLMNKPKAMKSFKRVSGMRTRIICQNKQGKITDEIFQKACRSMKHFNNISGRHPDRLLKEQERAELTLTYGEKQIYSVFEFFTF